MLPVLGSMCFLDASLTLEVIFRAVSDGERSEDTCPAIGVRECVDEGVVVPESSSCNINKYELSSVLNLV